MGGHVDLRELRAAQRFLPKLQSVVSCMHAGLRLEQRLRGVPYWLLRIAQSTDGVAQRMRRRPYKECSNVATHCRIVPMAAALCAAAPTNEAHADWTGVEARRDP